MTPAINTAIKAKIKHQIHEYTHDETAPSYGLEAAEKLQVEASRIFKTLVVELDQKQWAVGILPVTTSLSMKLIAKACTTKKAHMANVDDVQRITGYVMGGVSPLGQKKQLPTVIDSSAKDFDTIYVSAGKRGLDIELSSEDLQTLTRASFADIKQK